MSSIKIPMPRIIDAIGTATPVMLDSTWRKIEYRLDVLGWVRNGVRRGEVINFPPRGRISRLNGGINI